MSAGTARTPRSGSGAGANARAWGGAGAPSAPLSASGAGVCMAEILSESSAARSAAPVGPARTTSDTLAQPQRTTPAASSSWGGTVGAAKKKGTRGKRVTVSLDEFQAGGAESGSGQGGGSTSGMHAERSGADRSSAVPAWGRPRSSAPVDTSEVRMTPPSLSAIMTDERSKLQQQSAKTAATNVSTGSTTAGARSQGGRAWGQTQDLSEIRQAVIDEALFQRASQLPDIRPTGHGSQWGRTHATEAVSVAKIEDIQMEEQARRVSATATTSESTGGAAATCMALGSSSQHMQACSQERDTQTSGEAAAVGVDAPSSSASGGQEGGRRGRGKGGDGGRRGRGGGGVSGRDSRGSRGGKSTNAAANGNCTHTTEEAPSQGDEGRGSGGGGGRGDKGGSRGRGGKRSRGKPGGRGRGGGTGGG